MPHVRFHPSFAVLALLAGCGHPAPATPTQTNPRDFPPPAPWMGTTSLASSEDTERFAEALGHLVQTFTPPPTETTSIPPDSRRRILWVRDVGVGSMADVPPLGWRWTSVTRGINDLGNRIPLVWDSKLKSLASHDALLGHVVVGPPTVEEHDPVLFGDLVHETSHYVFETALLSASGFTRTEWAALRRRCDDTWIFWQFASETVALRNHISWLISSLRAQGATMTIRRGNVPILLDQAFLQDRRAFAAFVLEALPERSHPTGIRCGPPIALRGPWAGQYIRPWEVATAEGSGREENIVSPYLASAYPELKRRAGIP